MLAVRTSVLRIYPSVFRWSPGFHVSPNFFFIITRSCVLFCPELSGSNVCAKNFTVSPLCCYWFRISVAWNSYQVWWRSMWWLESEVAKTWGRGGGMLPDDGELTYLLFAFKKGKLCYVNVLLQNLKCLNKSRGACSGHSGTKDVQLLQSSSSVITALSFCTREYFIMNLGCCYRC
jgi:hypothetical protein